MDLAEGFGAGRRIEGFGDQVREIDGIHFLEELPNQSADDAGRKAFGGTMDGGDPFEMNRGVGVIFDDFEIGMIDDDLAAAAFGFAVNDEALAGGDDFFDPIKVEPPDGDLAGKRVAFFVNEDGFEYRVRPRIRLTWADWTRPQIQTGISVRREGSDRSGMRSPPSCAKWRSKSLAVRSAARSVRRRRLAPNPRGYR